jgi:SAM-dependent methyltransferase
MAEVSDLVVGIDPDPASIAAALHIQAKPVEFIEADFLDHNFGDRTFDFIGAIASVHHMPFVDALAKMAGLLRPGGVLGIIGLYRSTTPIDRVVELAAIPVNIVLALTRSSAPMVAPVVDATMTLASVRATAADILPGAVARRLLLWRYLLTWRKPAAL